MPPSCEVFELLLLEDSWYTVLVRNMKRHAQGKSFQSGVPFALKTKLIFKTHVLQRVQSLFQQRNDTLAVKKIAAIVTGYHGVGRSGE